MKRMKTLLVILVIVILFIGLIGCSASPSMSELPSAEPTPVRTKPLPTVPPPTDPTPRPSPQPLPTKPPPTASPIRPLPSNYPVLPDDSMAPQLPLAELKNEQGIFEFMNIPWAASLEDVERTLGMSLIHSPGNGDPRNGDQYNALALYQYDPYRVITKFVFYDDHLTYVNFTFLSRYGGGIEKSEASNLLYYVTDELIKLYGDPAVVDTSEFANPDIIIFIWESAESEGNMLKLTLYSSGTLYLDLIQDAYKYIEWND